MGWFQNTGIILFASAYLMCLGTNSAQAQLSLDVELEDALINSQSIDIQSLIANNGQGPRLFQLYLQNKNSDEYANDLYFRIIIESEKVGRIADIKQVDGRPFNLRPGQRVQATNNNMGNGLPGVKEVIQFDGNFTQEGKEFVNDLRGSTSLPADQYNVTVEIYQGTVGGELKASTSAEVGANIVEETYDFYLLSPGDAVGADAVISNTYPNFQWQGDNNASYRLIVVEARENDNPQSLVEGAASTDPVRGGGSSSGSLLDYEMLDVIVDRSSYQYPNSGVQELEPGKEYYWRVINQRETSRGVQGRESEIWSFSIIDTRKGRTAQQNSEVEKALRLVLGSQLEQIGDDLSFESIVIDGQTFRGGEALQKLLELGRRAEHGDVSIVIEEQ